MSEIWRAQCLDPDRYETGYGPDPRGSVDPSAAVIVIVAVIALVSADAFTDTLATMMVVAAPLTAVACGVGCDWQQRNCQYQQRKFHFRYLRESARKAAWARSSVGKVFLQDRGAPEINETPAR